MAKGSVGLDIGSRTVHIAQVQSGRGGCMVTNWRRRCRTTLSRARSWIPAPSRSRSSSWSWPSSRRRRSDWGGEPTGRRPPDRTAVAGRVRAAILAGLPGPGVHPDRRRGRGLDFTSWRFENDAGVGRSACCWLRTRTWSVYPPLSSPPGSSPSASTNPFAILRTIHAEATMASGPEVTVDIGAGVTDIIVHQGGTPKFVRILVLGGDDITDALMGHVVGTPGGGGLKQQVGADGSGPDPTAYKIVADQARSFIDEVRSSLDFYRAQVGVIRSPVCRSPAAGRRWPDCLAARRCTAAAGVPGQPARPADRQGHRLLGGAAGAGRTHPDHGRGLALRDGQ